MSCGRTRKTREDEQVEGSRHGGAEQEGARDLGAERKPGGEQDERRRREADGEGAGGLAAAPL
jgi:hypothetical protein